MTRTGVILFVLFPVLLLSACHKPTEEDKVRKVVADIQKAAEEKSIRTILDRVSKTYRDPQGNDYEGVKGLLAFYFFRHQSVSVFLPSLDVTVTDTAARAVFQAVLTGRGGGESAAPVFPEALGVYDFDVAFAKEEGGWKVTSAVWKRVGDAPAASTNP